MKEEKRKWTIDQLKKGDPLKAPDGYFDDLEDRVRERISLTQPAKTRLFTPALIRIAYAVAASISVIAICLSLYINNVDEQTPQQLLASVSAEELENYLEHEDLDVADIVNATDAQAWDDEGLDLFLPGIDTSDLDAVLDEYPLNTDDSI
jgi:hypothetical protein